MRKILILFALLLLLPMTMEAKKVAQFRIFKDSLYSATVKSDTSAWWAMPENCDSLRIMVIGQGATAGDAISGIVDFAEHSTTDDLQLWSAQLSKAVTVGAAKANGTDGYAYPEAFAYLRLIRAITTVTTGVTMRAWLVAYTRE